VNAGSLWVARHAPVAVTSTCYGRTDVATSVSAEEAAALLVDAYEGVPPAVVWSSPMTRCLSVAALVARSFDASLRVDASLHELDFGAWDGLTWSAITREHPAAYARWLEDWENVPPPRGELPRDLELRVRTWLGAVDTGQTHALVAHAGVVRALRVVAEGSSWLEAMERAAPHLSWSRFALRATPAT
jgi:alpha-ribazole phosphatase